MSSKSQDEKDDGQEGKNEDLDILDLVQKYCISNDFESAFESFAEDNFEIFKDALDFKVHGQEHPREYHDVYLKYIAKFEGLIEDFIVKNGYTLKRFYDICRRVVEDEGTLGSKRFFIETMLAISEYENFFLLMQSEIRLQQHSRKRREGEEGKK
eukprot:gene10025-11087_t